MAYPPPVLPVNRTDSLNQQTNHPSDHNAANQAINDTVGQLNLTTSFAQTTNGKVDALTTVVNGKADLSYVQTVNAKADANTDKVNSIVTPQTMLTAGGGPGIATVNLASPVTLALPGAGTYLVGFNIDVNPSTLGWVFLTAQAARAGGTVLVQTMSGGRYFEPGSFIRSILAGSTIVTVSAADTLHLRVATYASNVNYESSTLTAYRLLPGP